MSGSFVDEDSRYFTTILRHGAGAHFRCLNQALDFLSSRQVRFLLQGLKSDGKITIRGYAAGYWINATYAMNPALASGRKSSRSFLERFRTVHEYNNSVSKP